MNVGVEKGILGFGRNLGKFAERFKTILRNAEQVRTVSNTRIRVARVVAICADLVQIGFPYIFGEGFLSPFQDVLDVAVCITMTLLVGWHFAFLPSFLVKMVPIVDLAPTWTIAVFIATRRGKEGAGDGSQDAQIKDATVLKDERVDAPTNRNKD